MKQRDDRRRCAGLKKSPGGTIGNKGGSVYSEVTEVRNCHGELMPGKGM
jgi:hypothetical protein